MSNSGSLIVDGISAAYVPLGEFYASDWYVLEARNESTYVGVGAQIIASGSAGKVDLSAGIVLINGVEVNVAAVTAFATTIGSISAVSSLTSGQALWIGCEIDATGTLNFNTGTAAAVTATAGPIKPTPNTNRVVVAWIYVPYNASSYALDANLSSAVGTKSKIQEARQLVPGVSPSGWQYEQNTWVFASSKSFTIASVDATGYLKPGTFVSWNDGTNAPGYGVVASSSFSTNTTVNLIETSDYPIANATIIRPRFSYQSAPIGFPADFNYDPATIAGWAIFPGISSVNLNPVTTTIASSLFTKTSHGLVNGNAIQIATISTTTGISVATRYYVVSATTNTFQVSATVGGSAITLGGTADSNLTVSLSTGCYKWIPFSSGWIKLIVRHGTDGTSGNAAHTATLPVAAAAVTNAAWQALTRSTDNATAGTGVLSILSAGTIVTEAGIATTVASTATGAGRIPSGTVDYRYA